MDEPKRKVALVTGASRGIGTSIARRLAKSGLRVVLNYHSSREHAEAVAGEIRSEGGDAFVVGCDVADPESVQAMFNTIKDNAGGVDILVNNAGVTKDTATYRMSIDDWNRVISTNLSGSFHCIKAAVFDMMKNKGGRIINMSSLSSYYGAPGQANYAASKAGIVGLTRCLASEFGPMNITVNAVIPGLIPTDMTAKIPKPKMDALASKIPLKRLGGTGDIASLVDFLASDAAGYITGQVIMVDGGLSCSIGS